ncbi:TATA-binding protein associated factor Taf2 [Coprinopsis cinerea okayama7|uniref:Transcription initiation factor TFIID subunit 2 n=1 Tax=Coprinopsis cinerea (strain Okayama-7 / 130 / ATCC MYA-4618 / FGSC 9003) TaxID=240176 RepID=A8N357_COPC7|nr:TATA-binding protein associated factor Taf2 [Coprinopsis cinerea okayama7\|eukprot:XP_001829302.2 TATA-binding protein associated factor Taf2 [Coprinopsis cinerea okayama7\
MGATAEAQDCHRHAELKRKLYSAMQESDEGELSIAIPKEVALRPSGHSSHPLVREVSTPEPQTPGQATQSDPEFSPIVVNIAYSLRNPVDGFEFVVPNDAYPYRVPHAFTSPSSPDSARCWVPCVDNLWEKCTWEFEFVVPRYLEERVDNDDDEEPVDLTPTIVICSGELVEQVAHPYNSNKTIFIFSQAILTSVQHIAFAAGPFHLFQIPPDSTIEDSAGSSQPAMYAFCLPGLESQLATSTAFLRSAMTFYTSEYGSYPFGSFKLVFVDELPTQRFDSATLSLITSDLLHGDDAIDQALETRHTLSHALACQWAGVNIIPKTWSDTWLINGLSLYINGLFLRKLFGNNDYRFKLKKDMQRVLEWDVGVMPPICQPQINDPPDPSTLPFVNLKSPLVLHILDRKLGKSGTALGLSRVLPKVFLSAISGELQNNALSTHAFLRTCRKVSGVDLRSFAEQWIYGSGCPSFGFSASFNRKKMAVEITMRQEAPAFKALEHNEIGKALLKPVPFFEGQMTIRIHEADGTPYEHVLDIRNPFKRYEVPFNTKYKRVRRNTKRYLARQAAAQAAAEGDAEAAEAMGMIDMGFGLEIWEKEQERENWKVADWTEEDEATMSGATYEWIRIDADFEWIANMKFEQPDFMWVSQLQRDRDVVAQLEAIYALAEKPTAIVSSTLTKTVLVSNYYYRVRCEAALALVSCAIRRLDFLGLFHLFKLFLRYCYDPEDPNQDLFTHKYVPKPNNFSDFPEYFVRKTLITAISQVRFENGNTPSVVRQFLIDQLRYNDNTSNPYTDGYYICTIIAAAACAIISMAPPERGELMPSDTSTELNAEDLELIKQTRIEVDRYRSMDRLIPSPHNIVTIAALEFYMALGVANLIPSHPKVFFPLTREGNYTQVRIAAFDGLFMTKWYAPQIMNLALLAQMGEMKSAIKESESLLIEEDGNGQERMKESKRSELDVMLKILRKDRELGKNEVVREFLLPVALLPEIDHEVRWCLLKLADLLIRPVEETPPTVKIHIPSTPVIETPPQIPTIKPPRIIKSGGPPPKHPLNLVNAPTRLKLPGAPTVALPKGPPTALVPEPPKRNVAFVPPPTTPVATTSKQKPPKPAKPVSTKPVSVPKAQSAGMSIQDYKACKSALKKLKANKHALLFLQPVDPIRDHAPNYFDIIKEPMDLSTMGAKLEEGLYKDRFAFQQDFRLMIANAKLYNMVGSFVHNEAITLETFFEKQWSIINKTLEAADRTHNAPKSVVPSSKVTPSALPAKPTPRILPPVPAFRKSPSPARPEPPQVSKPPRPEPKEAKPTPGPSTAPRPTIKLKMGSQSKAGPPTPSPAPAPPVVPPVKVRKPKPIERAPSPVPIDGPPPPYVDDGSHDILQEVLAIEREKDEQRRSRESRERERDRDRDRDRDRERDRDRDRDRVRGSGVNGVSMKRKKDIVDEDDLLALVTKKKERISPPGSTSAGSSKSEPLAPAPPKVHLPAPKPVPAAATPARSSGTNSGRATPVVPPPQPKPKKDKLDSVPLRISLNKGKEKEVTPALTSPAPSQSKSKKGSVIQATPVNEKKVKELLKTLTRIPEAAIFLRPVDPVLDGCPTYLDEIAHPMDFGTMNTKLQQGLYMSMEDVKKDIELIFANCRQFNPVGTFPVDCADIVERAFKKEWPKAMERKLSWAEKRGLQAIMSTIVKEPVSWVFREPVDPVLLGIPTYFDVIPRKDARDLRTIRSKLDSDKYDTVEAWEADIDLMIANAIKFNGADSEVGIVAKQLRHRVNELVSNWKSSMAKKRKDGEQSNSQPSKKVKI